MSDITDPPLYLERIDPRRNMARFYAMSVQPTLFGEVSLVRRWGRIGARDRYKIETFSQPEEIAGARSRIERQKRGRRYQETQITEIGGREGPLLSPKGNMGMSALRPGADAPPTQFRTSAPETIVDTTSAQSALPFLG